MLLTIQTKPYSQAYLHSLRHENALIKQLLSHNTEIVFTVLNKYIQFQWDIFQLLIIIIIYYFGIRCAKPGESEDTISPKTPTPHNQPMEGRKR